MDKTTKKVLTPKQLLNILTIGTDDDNEMATDEGDSSIPAIDGYHILEIIGHSGQGQVWSAVQLSTNRKVAVKIPSFQGYSPQKAFLRFEREIEVAAGFQHPNIVQIYDSGIYKGAYYYVMELIEGQHLDDYIQEKNLDIRKTLELMQKVCGAVHYAHQRGFIHRDLKPSNILVTEDGEPHLVDFGLAKALINEHPELTISSDHQVAGTLAFMSPEQAAGDSRKIDYRTDIYSLGVILYHVLTKDYPHELSGTRQEILTRIAHEPINIQKKGIPKELCCILQKALIRNPQERYATIDIFAQDIQNYLDNKPLIAGPQSALYILKKKLCRHKILTGFCLGLAGILLFSGFTYAYYSKYHYRDGFEYPSGINVIDTLNWQKIRGTKEIDVNSFIIAQQFQEQCLACTMGKKDISDYTIHAINSDILILQPDQGFIASVNISYNGYYEESVGIAFCIQNANNFYFAEFVTKIGSDNHLRFQRYINDSPVILSEQSNLKIDWKHEFQLAVQYDALSHSYTISLIDAVNQEPVAFIDNIHDSTFNSGLFGIATKGAGHTALDNYHVEVIPKQNMLYAFTRKTIHFLRKE